MPFRLIAASVVASVLLCGAATAADLFRVVRDVPYVESGHWRQKVDLYVPTAARGAVPVFVWIHGGAWLAGSKVEGAAFAFLAERGFAVASVGYRLSGDAPFPAQIDDVRAAVGWLARNAGEFGADGGRIVVAGQSAGGHLASLLGATAGSLTPALPVVGVIDFYGPADLRAGPIAEDYRNRPAVGGAVALAAFLGGSPQQKPAVAAAASPVTHVTADDCPFLIVHGDRDPIVPIAQSRRLDTALRAAGVPTEFVVVPGGGHGGRGFGDLAVRERMTAFLEEVTGAE